jgi:hypothetical protein
MRIAMGSQWTAPLSPSAGRLANDRASMKAGVGVVAIGAKGA